MEKQKECFKCNVTKPLSYFYKHPQMQDGTVNKCKDCNKAENKNNWWKHRDEKIIYDRGRYRYSIDRLKKHKYKGIINRCHGKHKNHNYTVLGKPYLTWGEFLEWWDKNNDIFLPLYNEWEKSGFQNKLAPSIDRIKEDGVYEPSNMQWLTLSENCSKRYRV